MKASPALLTVALLLASVGGATAGPAFGDAPRPEPRADPANGASAPSATVVQIGVLEPTETFTNVLTLDEPRRANATSSRANLSAALVLRENSLDRQLTHRSVRRKLTRMNDTDRLRQYIGHAIVELEIRADELRTAERKAYRLHNEGRITSRELLSRLARIDARAEQLSRNASILAEAAEGIEGTGDTGRLGALRLELQAYQGPVRDRVAETLRGAAPPTRVYVQTGTDGVVLSTIIDDEYVREVYEGSRHTEGGERISVGRIDDVLRESYPIVYRRSNGNVSTPQGQQQASSVFSARIRYDTGELLTYIDRSNAKVFRERQRIRLNRSPPTEPRTVTQAGLELTVYPSYRSGPMLIRVEDPRSGNPVRGAKVTLTSLSGDGRTSLIGQTDRQGRLWAVMPNESVRVNAIDPDRSTKFAAVRVSPVDPRRVRADDDNVTATNGTEASVAVPEAGSRTGPGSTAVLSG